MLEALPRVDAAGDVLLDRLERRGEAVQVPLRRGGEETGAVPRLLRLLQLDAEVGQLRIGLLLEKLQLFPSLLDVLLVVFDSVLHLAEAAVQRPCLVVAVALHRAQPRLGDHNLVVDPHPGLARVLQLLVQLQLPALLLEPRVLELLQRLRLHQASSSLPRHVPLEGPRERLHLALAADELLDALLILLGPHFFAHPCVALEQLLDLRDVTEVDAVQLQRHGRERHVPPEAIDEHPARLLSEAVVPQHQRL
mmetsp:Transcript_54803/g.141161  ORF Transcript_54803/g.141161 Transcript_54803/m.141161 type:complete len:251 (+) Transcript_54803:275-1027(+)